MNNKMNNIEEYGKEITAVLAERHPELKFDFNPTIVKNNGITLSGISIRKEDSNISPMIYINNLYDDERTVEEAIDEVWNIYIHNHMHQFNYIDKIQDFDYIKNYFFISLVNLDKNQAIMETCPYAMFGDLLVYFIIVIDDNANGRSVIKINNMMMEQWGVTLSDILEPAFNNISKNPAQIVPMNIMLNNLLEMQNISLHDAFGIDELPEAVPMYIVTNNFKNHGCVYLAHKNTLLAISKQIGLNSFYIIPSSIHELIVVPEDGIDGTDPCSILLDMVKDVNKTSLPESEFLSDNVYHFDATSEELVDAEGNKLIFLS